MQQEAEASETQCPSECLIYRCQLTVGHDGRHQYRTDTLEAWWTP